ncbi:MAG: hypothetical protein LBP93_00590 [Treponema sp.]|jgi:hypothetical protein|nr:hypothetical protein [Treponema sp.]
MKRITALGILGILCGTLFVFAEDAKVMPARMGRVYLAPSFSFANKAWDAEGDKQDLTDGNKAIKMFNLGFAVEYGIIDWITGAIQWAPGWNAWSDVDYTLNMGPLGNKELDANLKGFGDIFVGAKIQIIGADAPVKNSSVRLAIGPGVKIPLPGPDFTEEQAKIMNDEAVTVGKIDKHTFGFGARTYFDYVINDMFSVSAYNEFIYYPLKVKGKNHGIGTPAEADVAYGFDLTFELEPHFDKTFGNGLLFHAGLPVNYKFTPDIKIDGTTQDDSATQVLSLKPNASIFLTQLPLPLQFQLAYTVPLWGKNTNATNSLVFQIRAYFKI